MQQKGRSFALAMAFESGLGFLGLGIAWLAGVPLADNLALSRSGLELGVLATVPMLTLLVAVTLSNWAPLVEIRKQIETLVGELFGSSSWLELALISIAAGVGEEILFRGALQPWIAGWTTPWVSLAVVSMLFGLAHAMSTSYFVLATLIGAYLGWLTIEYQDLLAPIVAHSLYDFIALLYIRQRTKL